VTNIPLAMLAVFGTAKLLAELFEHFGQPGIVGEILAGVLIGPSALGWIQPNQFFRRSVISASSSCSSGSAWR
jgi:Kef-type K+ transport system membrane component KefB